MKARITMFLAALGCLSVVALAASADEADRDIKAAHNYGHRKVAHVHQAVHATHVHYSKWKQRKHHNVRQWLNTH